MPPVKLLSMKPLPEIDPYEVGMLDVGRQPSGDAMGDRTDQRHVMHHQTVAKLACRLVQIGNPDLVDRIRVGRGDDWDHGDHGVG